MDANGWQDLQRLYASMLLDIKEGKDLQRHLDDIESAIKELDKLIDQERQTGISTTRLDEMKNDLYYLKYEILERL